MKRFTPKWVQEFHLYQSYKNILTQTSREIYNRGHSLTMEPVWRDSIQSIFTSSLLTVEAKNKSHDNLEKYIDNAQFWS